MCLLSLGRNGASAVTNCTRLRQRRIETTAFYNFIVNVSFPFCRMCLYNEANLWQYFHREQFIVHSLCNAQELACSKTSIRKPQAVQGVQTMSPIMKRHSVSFISSTISSWGANSLSWIECKLFCFSTLFYANRSFVKTTTYNWKKIT